jgi:hypothetical protein
LEENCYKESEHNKGGFMSEVFAHVMFDGEKRQIEDVPPEVQAEALISLILIALKESKLPPFSWRHVRLKDGEERMEFIINEETGEGVWLPYEPWMDKALELMSKENAHGIARNIDVEAMTDASGMITGAAIVHVGYLPIEQVKK